MSNILNLTNIKEVNFINGQSGQFKAIVKVQAGFMTTVDDLGIQAKWKTGPQWTSAIDVFRNFKKGALQTILFRPENTDTWLTVFARNGKKIILMDKQLFADIEVGDVNQNWSNTNLYDQKQYAVVNAKNWACKVFVPNKISDNIIL